MEGPLVLFWVSKVAANTAFLVELQALALAVLAVQSVLPRAGLLAILQRYRIDRFVAVLAARLQR